MTGVAASLDPQVAWAAGLFEGDERRRYYREWQREYKQRRKAAEVVAQP